MLLVSTKSCMAHNHELNVKESVCYRKNLWLDSENMELAEVILAVRPQTESICEGLVGEHVFESNPQLKT